MAYIHTYMLGVDLVANVIVTRQGFGGMAFSACFAAPIFSTSCWRICGSESCALDSTVLIARGVAAADILFGLGLSTAFEIALYYGPTVPYPVTFSPHLIIAVVTLFVSAIATLVVVPFNGWQSPPKHGLLLLVLYFVFAALSLLTELKVIF